MSTPPRPEPQDLDPVVQANRRAKGKRPQFFADPAVERVLAITMALVAELAVARERIDTLERVLITSGHLAPDAIEAFVPDAAAQSARDAMGRAYISRVLRILEQDVQAMQDGAEPSLEQWMDELGRPPHNNQPDVSK
jgi:hypothetical protein